MKILKLSLVASLALGALSTASFAQPLEEAIKGIDVSGYLRYRYNDDRYDNQKNVEGVKGGNATHRWKAVADFRTPVVDNVAFNLGILYNNESQNVNHGKGIPSTNTDGTTTTIPFLGNGLGAGKDSSFGVRNFYAVVTPDSTATTIIAGKQVLNTPVTNANDDDRGTGIMVLNSDIPNLTLGVAVFDSWSTNDAALLNGITGSGYAVDKMLYAIAAIYNNDTSIGNIGAQVWGFHIDDAVDSLIFSELSWKGSLFNVKLQYAFSKLADDSDVFGTLYGFVSNESGANVANIATDNDVLIAEVGVNLRKDYSMPFDAKLGYITNFQDGTAVSLEDEGYYAKAGKIWWQNSATGFSFSALPASGMTQYGYNKTADVDVFYGALNFGFLEDRFKIGLEGVFGKNNIETPVVNATNIQNKIKFREIAPTFSWKHNKNLTFSGYYAMLTTEVDAKDADGVNKPDEDRNRLRLEARYNF